MMPLRAGRIDSKSIWHLTLELSGGVAVRLDEWLGGHSVSHKSKVEKRANYDDGNYELNVPYQPVALSIYSDLDVVQVLVIALT